MRSGLFIAAAILSLAACQSSGRGSGTEPGPPPATHRDIAALGRLEPRDPVAEISAGSEDRVERLFVETGQVVKTGDILAHMESRASRMARRAEAAARLSEAERRFRAEVDRTEARIREAETRLRLATAVPQREVEVLHARIAETRATLTASEADLTRYQALFARHAVSRQELDRRQAEVSRLNAEVQSLEASIARVETARETETRQLEAELSVRHAERDSVIASGIVNSVRQNLNQLDEEVRRAEVRAPADGRILEVLARPGESAGGRPLLRMGDTRQMYVRAEVYETEASRVSPGQAVEITSGALPGTLTGTVERIDSLIQRREVRDLDPLAETDARVVHARIRLNDSTEAARFVGLQVQVRIRAAAKAP